MEREEKVITLNIGDTYEEYKAAVDQLQEAKRLGWALVSTEGSTLDSVTCTLSRVIDNRTAFEWLCDELMDNVNEGHMGGYTVQYYDDFISDLVDEARERHESEQKPVESKCEEYRQEMIALQYERQRLKGKLQQLKMRNEEKHDAIYDSLVGTAFNLQIAMEALEAVESEYDPICDEDSGYAREYIADIRRRAADALKQINGGGS